jgi:hypothetical protein
LGVIQFIFHECRNCSDPKSCLKDSQVDCDESFLARQSSGWLSVSGLGAVSAESYGRDSFCRKSAGLGQLRFGLSAEADDHQTE